MDSDLKNIDDDKEIKVAIIIFCIDIFDLLFNVHGNIRPTSQIKFLNYRVVTSLEIT